MKGADLLSAAAVAAGLALALAPAPAPAEPSMAKHGGQSGTNVRFPLQRHPNGRVKELFLAESATITTGGLFRVDGELTVLLLDEEGATNGIARARDAVYDRDRNIARSEGPVHLALVAKGITLGGTNLVWNGEGTNTVVSIERDAVLTLHRGGETSLRRAGK